MKLDISKKVLSKLLSTFNYYDIMLTIYVIPGTSYHLKKMLSFKYLKLVEQHAIAYN